MHSFPSTKPVPTPVSGSLSSSSHIMSIPNEILIRVMQLALPGSGLPHDTFSAALKLSHVSRRFRFVAHRTSELWTAICPKFPLGRDQAQFWTDTLERSGGRLIDIVINTEVGLGGAIQSYKAFLGAVVCRFIRWRKFEITSNPWQPTGFFPDRSQRLVLPGLEELALHHSEAPGQGLKTWLPYSITSYSVRMSSPPRSKSSSSGPLTSIILACGRWQKTS